LKKFTLSILLTLILSSQAVYGDDFQDGVDAWSSKDYKTALEKLKPLAEQGNVKAQLLLGAMYEKGQGIPQDYKEAVKWYQKSAVKKDAGGQFFLGEMYRMGAGVPQNYKEAVKWYQKSANQGDDFAMFRLGQMYNRGTGVPQNYKEAVIFYQKAAEKGLARAQLELATMYAEGKGVKKDKIKAHKWANLAGANELKDGREFRDNLENVMTNEQIEKAQELAKEWMKKH